MIKTIVSQAKKLTEFSTGIEKPIYSKDKYEGQFCLLHIVKKI